MIKEFIKNKKIKNAKIDRKNIKKALDIIAQYALIEGEHHKNWVIVLITQALCNNEKKYQRFVNNYNEDVDSLICNGWKNMVKTNCIAP